MKELKKQLFCIWERLNPKQKKGLIGVTILIASYLLYVVCHSSLSSYSNLYISGRLSSSDREHIRSYLNKKGIDYKEKKEGQIYVSDENIPKVRSALSDLGIPKNDMNKGFELFDSNTWIKGEKELQVLQMRALKGQLEKDLAEFDHIKSASVILDLPSHHSFENGEDKAKASVILTLMPNALLFPSELQAIAFHLAGAVQGLKPNMIAISDTQGRLYQAIDPDAKGQLWLGAEFFFEEHLKEKIEKMLHALYGTKSFIISVGAKLKENTKPNLSVYDVLLSVDVFLLVDSNRFTQDIFGDVQKAELKKNIGLLLQNISVPVNISIENHPFFIPENISKSTNYVVFWIPFISIISLFLAYYLIKKKNKKEQPSSFRDSVEGRANNSLEHILFKLEKDTLCSLMREEDPDTLAILFSGIEKSNAENLIASLPVDLQQKVLKALIDHHVL